MTTQTLARPLAAQRLNEAPAIPKNGGRLYAITFDMDIESLKIHYGDPYNNAYSEIRKVLQKQGFTWQQGSVYFGGEGINAVTCVLATIELSRALPGFPPRCATSACFASKKLTTSCRPFNKPRPTPDPATWRF